MRPSSSQWCLAIGEGIFTVRRVMENWNRLPREVVEPPSMEIFKTCLDTYLCDLLYSTVFSRGVELNLLRSFPTPVIL